MTPNESIPSVDLTKLAKQALTERGLIADIPLSVQQAVATLEPVALSSNWKDLRDKLWFSIDNEESRDLDQLTYIEPLNQGQFRLYVAIADVDVLVKKDSIIDEFAQQNTSSVYTPTKVFPMLPDKLSTDLTSLIESQERAAIIIEIVIELHGRIESYSIYPGFVVNRAKLYYHSVAAWLDGRISAPSYFTNRIGLLEQLRMHDELAARLKNYWQEQGSLSLQTLESRPIIENGVIIDVKVEEKNRARELIEQCMIVANIVTARFLTDHGLPSLRRIVRIPKRWDRIVEIAKSYGEDLPDAPDSKALDLFLIKRRLSDPLRFPDLSLMIVKLLGRGEYTVQHLKEDPIGHFSLALKDYTRSTAPNRRYADVINQRLIKSVFHSNSLPYPIEELERLAAHCTKKEADVEKVERRMKKSAATLVLASRINEEFDALVTGKTLKGTWVRIFHPPIEGKLIEGFEGLDVGDKLQVKLVHADVEQGFIDFKRI